MIFSLRTYARDACALIIITLLVIAFFFRLFWPTPQLVVTPDFGRSDAWHFSIATKYVLWQNIHAHRIPLWSEHMGSGFPIYAEGQMGTFFAPNLILYSLFNFTTAYNLSLVFIFLFLGWGLYIWLRLLSLRTLAAFFGAITFAFSGVFMTQIPHITLLQGFSLLPWILVALHFLVTRRSLAWIALTSIVISQQIFAGFPQATFITLLLGVTYVVFISWRKQTWFVSLLRLAISLTMAATLSAIQLLPSYEFLKNITDPGGFSPTAATYFSFPFVHFRTFFDPFILGNPKLGTYPAFYEFNGSIFWENTGYVGIVPIIFSSFLLLTRLAPKKKRRHTTISYIPLLFAGLAISLLLMLGNHSPLYLIYSVWPFNLFRVPSRFLFLFVVALVSLSAYGIHMLLTNYFSRLTWCLIGILIVLNTSLLFSTWYNFQAVEPAASWLAKPPVATSVSHLNGNILTVGSEASYNNIFIKQGWTDIKGYFFLRNALAPNSNLLWNITNIQAYAGRHLRRPTLWESMFPDAITQDEHTATVSAVGKKYLDLSSVRYLISTLPLTQEGLMPWSTYSDDKNTVTVFENFTALPRVYMTNHVVTAKTVEEAAKAIRDESFIPGSSVLLEKQVSVDQKGEKGRAAIISSADTSITIEVKEHPQTSVLVVNDTYYPGWTASVDGKPTEIYPANIRFRAVLVPYGDHIVRMIYQPNSFRWGLRISLLTTALTIVLWVFHSVIALWYRHHTIPWPSKRPLNNPGKSRSRKA